VNMLICYATKPEWADENVSLIENFCEELRSTEPELFRYAAFMAYDEVTFFHFPFMDAGVSPFTNSPAFDAFKQDIDQRYAHKPERVVITEVGSYNMAEPAEFEND